MNQLSRSMAKILSWYPSCYPSPIYEFGSRQVEGQEVLANLRPLFKDTEYIGCDIEQGNCVDKIFHIENIDLPYNSVGTPLCFCVLEHVKNPERAIQELIRVTNGTLMITVPFACHIHEFPIDYWRFTPQCIGDLLMKYTNSSEAIMTLYSFGPYINPDQVTGLIFKKKPEEFEQFFHKLGSFATYYSNHRDKTERLRKWLPSKLVDIIRKDG